MRGKGFPSFVLHCSSLFLGQRFLCSRVSGKSPAVSPAALVKWRLVSYQRDRGLIFRLFAVPVLGKGQPGEQGFCCKVSRLRDECNTKFGVAVVVVFFFFNQGIRFKEKLTFLT